jgi:hypothetical protein
LRCSVDIENSFRLHLTPTTRSPSLLSCQTILPSSHLGNVLPHLPPLVTHLTPILRIRLGRLPRPSYCQRIHAYALLNSQRLKKYVHLDVCPAILDGHRPSPASTTSAASAPRKTYLQCRKRRRVHRVPNTPLRPSLSRASLPSSIKGRDRFSHVARVLWTICELETSEWKGKPISAFGHAF